MICEQSQVLNLLAMLIINYVKQWQLPQEAAWVDSLKRINDKYIQWNKKPTCTGVNTSWKFFIDAESNRT